MEELKIDKFTETLDDNKETLIKIESILTKSHNSILHETDSDERKEKLAKRELALKNAEKVFLKLVNKSIMSSKNMQIHIINDYNTHLPKVTVGRYDFDCIGETFKVPKTDIGSSKLITKYLTDNLEEISDTKLALKVVKTAHKCTKYIDYDISKTFERLNVGEDNRKSNVIHKKFIRKCEQISLEKKDISQVEVEQEALEDISSRYGVSKIEMNGIIKAIEMKKIFSVIKSEAIKQLLYYQGIGKDDFDIMISGLLDQDSFIDGKPTYRLIFEEVGVLEYEECHVSKDFIDEYINSMNEKDKNKEFDFELQKCDEKTQNKGRRYCIFPHEITKKEKEDLDLYSDNKIISTILSRAFPYDEKYKETESR